MKDVHAELRDLVDDIAAAVEDPERLWDTVVDLGRHTIGVPEGDGGSGGDLAEPVTVVSRFARRATSVPVAEHAVAARTLTRAGRPLPTGGPLVVALGGVPEAGGPYPGVPWGRRAAGLVVVGPDDVVRYADLAGRRVVAAEGANLAGEPRDTVVDLGDIPSPTSPTSPGHRTRTRSGPGSHAGDGSTRTRTRPGTGPSPRSRGLPAAHRPTTMCGARHARCRSGAQRDHHR